MAQTADICLLTVLEADIKRKMDSVSGEGCFVCGTVSISLGVYGREEKDSPCSQKFRAPTYALNVAHSVRRTGGGSLGCPRTVSCVRILSPFASLPGL